MQGITLTEVLSIIAIFVGIIIGVVGRYISNTFDSFRRDMKNCKENCNLRIDITEENVKNVSDDIKKISEIVYRLEGRME